MHSITLMWRVALIAALGLLFSASAAGVGVQNEQPVVVSFADQSALQAESSTQQVLDSFVGSLDIEKKSEFSEVSTASARGATTINTRISNGTLATKSQFPYATYIKMKIKNKWHLCGGTLIAPRVVLSAAHCVFTANGTTRSIEIYAIIGAADVATATTDNIVSVGGLARPKAYAPASITGRYGDIALLLLRFPSRKPKVALASTKTFNSSDLFVVAGWGQTGPGHTTTTRLRWARLPGVSSKAFQRWAAVNPDPELGQRPFKIEEDHVAVGLAAQPALDSCVGDSGGPLLLGGPNYSGSRLRQDVQVGIVSYGLTRICGGSPAIGFYTKVGYWRTWIDDTLSLNNWREYSTPTRQIVNVKYDMCFNGADLAKSVTKAAGACGEVCRLNSSCAAWSWNIQSKYCRLKTTSGRWTTTKGTCISASMKNPPPPPPVVSPPPPPPSSPHPPPSSGNSSSSGAESPAAAPEPAARNLK